MAESDVILIGGAPFSGKTTLAKRLAVQRGYALVAIDDLGTALRAVTTPQSHTAFVPSPGSKRSAGAPGMSRRRPRCASPRPTTWRPAPAVHARPTGWAIRSTSPRPV
jgi:hypothetical protein